MSTLDQWVICSSDGRRVIGVFMDRSPMSAADELLILRSGSVRSMAQLMALASIYRDEWGCTAFVCRPMGRESFSIRTSYNGSPVARHYPDVSYFVLEGVFNVHA